MITVIGHRANTPRWIKRFIKEGAHGIEIDFYCKNGSLYASHLDLLGRARLLRERVANLLTSMHLLGPYRFEDLISLIEPGKILMLDLKSKLSQECIDQLGRVVQRFDAFVSLREYQVAAMLSDLGIRTLLSMDHRPLNVLEELRETNAAGISINKKYLDEELAQRVREEGYLIAVWVVNSLSEARRVIGLGADILVTDYPGELIKKKPWQEPSVNNRRISQSRD